MALVFLPCTLLLLLLGANTCFGVESDIQCLRNLKNQLQDPNNYLSSWIFTNSTEGFICEFNGIECWHPHENRVINIRLSNMGLQGQFPLSLENCTNLTGLNLSHNYLSGTMPSDISTKLRYVTTLDLSSNKFSGEIPSDIENCSYLNVLNLQNNQLMGQIPEQVSNLTRLKTFNVSNNLLSGEVPPVILQSFNFSSFANNTGLCGSSFGACRSPPKPHKKSHNSIIIGSAIGAGMCLVLAIVVVFYLYVWRSYRDCRTTNEDVHKKEGKLRVKSTKRISDIRLQSTKRRRSCNINISMFAQSITKMRLIDILKATDNFNKDNIISAGRTCTMYRGTLEDGSLVVVKRLQDYHKNSDKHFISEMETLGSTRHPNLVPLLGFCIARRERLLIYKYMRNGTLYQHLHLVGSEGKPMEWRLRLQISIGVARGLAWLHHHCNPSIIHRNISSKAILFDEYDEPKISDFRSARLMNSYISGIFGDEGYVPPEFEHALDSIPKCDVYRFGVVMLELITGREPAQTVSTAENFNGNLVEWITHLSNYSRLQDAIDKSLIGKGYDVELIKFLKVACACVEFSPENRPTTSKVYQLLTAIEQRSNVLAEHKMFMPPTRINIHCQDEIIEMQD